MGVCRLVAALDAEEAAAAELAVLSSRVGA